MNRDGTVSTLGQVRPSPGLQPEPTQQQQQIRIVKVESGALLQKQQLQQQQQQIRIVNADGSLSSLSGNIKVVSSNQIGITNLSLVAWSSSCSDGPTCFRTLDEWKQTYPRSASFFQPDELSTEDNPDSGPSPANGTHQIPCKTTAASRDQGVNVGKLASGSHPNSRQSPTSSSWKQGPVCQGGRSSATASKCHLHPTNIIRILCSGNLHELRMSLLFLSSSPQEERSPPR